MAARSRPCRSNPVAAPPAIPPSRAQHTARELTPTQLYERYAPCVVGVLNLSAVTDLYGKDTMQASTGSGVLLTGDGEILTNYHVVKDCTQLTVTLYDGTEHTAKLLGYEEDSDIALLKIDGSGYRHARLGDSDRLRIGTEVAAIGNPLGDLDYSLNVGYISAKDRDVDLDGPSIRMMQLDAAINPGNSGGPLLNSYGEVVGIVSAKYSSYGSSGESVEGLGFAIPINDVISMIQDIMTNGYVSNKAYLGATIGTLTSGMAQQYRYDISQGAFVYSVEDGSPAADAGLQLGDVITAIDGTEITSLDDLTAAKKGYAAGDTSTLTVYRQGETITLELTWGAVSADQQSAVQDQTEQDQNGQSGGGYTNPYDLFEYFFG